MHRVQGVLDVSCGCQSGCCSVIAPMHYSTSPASHIRQHMEKRHPHTAETRKGFNQHSRGVTAINAAAKCKAKQTRKHSAFQRQSELTVALAPDPPHVPAQKAPPRPGEHTAARKEGTEARQIPQEGPATQLQYAMQYASPRIPAAAGRERSW